MNNKILKRYWCYNCKEWFPYWGQKTYSKGIAPRTVCVNGCNTGKDEIEKYGIIEYGITK